MANGHVQIHDPFAKPSVSPDPDPEPGSMEDTVEFRVLMAYAKRRRPQKGSPAQDAAASKAEAPSAPTETEQLTGKKKRKKKRMLLRLTRNIFSCTKPQTEDEEASRGSSPPDDRCAPKRAVFVREDEGEEEEEEEELNEVAERLTKMADEIPFVRPDIETDGISDANENVEKMIGLLLREAGDNLNEAELKDLTTKLSWDYGFFEMLMSTFLTRMGLKSPNPDSPGPKASPKTQIAVACEVTTRLSEFHPLPRNRLLDHGARYLQHYYSPWTQQHGGYEDAFYSDDEDDSQ
uniref:apoptosis facilitator Bcl-2-like protein 14 n=1 Tax=Gasterosteus aculeatus aculeatus TaxID=481459 RepID=UPI001A9A191C|nr:apoptosis facilitator Bcl-2-like protein 14 [Gasterosteus aculeatus aculeatus]